MVMDKPPHTGDYVDVAMRLRIKRTAEDQNTADSPKTYPRYGEIVVAWPLGEAMPKPKPKEKSKKEQDEELAKAAADNQEPLFPDDPDAELGDTFGADDNA